MGRWRRVQEPLAWTAALLALALVGALVPAASAANLERVPELGASCSPAKFGPGSPPGVSISWECIASGPNSASSEGIALNATWTGPGVSLDWENQTRLSSATSIVILRGAMPWSLDAVDAVSIDKDRYVDAWATLDGEFLWYQVVAVDGQGDAVARSPVERVNLPAST